MASVPQEIAGQPRRVVVGRVSWRHTFASLRHRNFRLFFVGQLVSLTGTWMQNTAQGWLTYRHGLRHAGTPGVHGRTRC